jgi:hypothetical protein
MVKLGAVRKQNRTRCLDGIIPAATAPARKQLNELDIVAA